MSCVVINPNTELKFNLTQILGYIGVAFVWEIGEKFYHYGFFYLIGIFLIFLISLLFLSIKKLIFWNYYF